MKFFILIIIISNKNKYIKELEAQIRFLKKQLNSDTQNLVNTTSTSINTEKVHSSLATNSVKKSTKV